MNKLTRILTMGGFGLLAALTTGAGAANAATPAGTPEAKTVASHTQWRAGDEVVGYYRTLRGCELAGQFGERAGDWDDHNCSITRIGVRRGAWALQVSSDDDWNRLGFGVPFGAIHGFPNQFRPVWAGQFNHRGGHGNDHGHGNNGHGNNGHGNDHGHNGHGNDHGHGHNHR